jgi:hypothetical protein
MNTYNYKCTNCKSEFNSDNIENTFHYLCPKCGIAEKNKPLKGVLQITYDYDFIREYISKDSFLKLEAGKFWLC